MQTSYQTNFDQLMLGMQTPGAVKEIVTGVAVEEIGFGVPVKRGTVEGTVELIDAKTDTVYGVSAKFDNALDLYRDGDTVSVITKGTVAVKVATAVTVAAGEIAYIIFTTGEFTNVAGTEDANPKVGVFQSSKKNDNLAIIKLDIVA